MQRTLGALRRRQFHFALAFVLAIGSSLTSTPARAATFWEGACVVNATVDFGSTSIGAVPISAGYTMSGTSMGGCVSSLGTDSLTMKDGIGTAVVSCDGIVSISGSLHFVFTNAPSAWGNVGLTASPAAAQTWYFSDALGSVHFLAVASLAWIKSPGVAACHLGGITQMNLKGVLVYEDPSLT